MKKKDREKRHTHTHAHNRVLMKSVYAKERESTSEKDRQKNGTNELTNKRTNERVKNKIQQQLWRYSTCGLRSDMRRERERVRWCESVMKLL